MLPDRVSNPGPLTYESGALPIALRGPALTRSRAFDAHECHNSPGAYVVPVNMNVNFWQHA